jgi:hypothetical protein
MSAALILAFRRKSGVERTIIKSAENGIRRIYLAIDGPANSADTEVQRKIVDAARQICKTFEIELSLLLREKNLGLAVAVLSALEWFFSKENVGYVFEDDLDISDEFFKFCNTGESALFQNERALLISGNQFLETPDRNIASVCSYPLIWGWYSTSYKWRVIKELTLEPSKKAKVRLSPKVVGFWNMGAWKARSRQIDSWAVPFAQNFHMQGYLSILPPRNLVSNIGMDEFAAHTMKNQTELGRKISFQETSLDYSKLFDPVRSREIDHYLENEVYRIRHRNFASNFKLLILKRFTSHSELKLRREFEESSQNGNN